MKKWEMKRAETKRKMQRHWNVIRGLNFYGAVLSGVWIAMGAWLLVFGGADDTRTQLLGVPFLWLAWITLRGSKKIPKGY